MNRRSVLKSIGSLVLLGASSFSIYKWSRPDSQFNFSLLAKRKSLIAELAETIIPRTSTPGAKDAKVEDFILELLAFCTTIREQHTFLNGLIDLEEYTFLYYKCDFAKCSLINKIEVLQHFENKSKYRQSILNKISNKILGKSFFTKLKELTVQGYCNSKLGASQGLAYDYIPSTYKSCIQITDHQLSWATK